MKLGGVAHLAATLASNLQKYSRKSFSYSRRLLRGKTFSDLAKVRFLPKNFHRLFAGVAAKCTTPPNFTKKTFANRYKISRVLKCSAYDSNQSPTFIAGHTIYAGSEGMAVLTPQSLGSARLHFITPTNITMTPPYVPPHTHTPSTVTLSHIHTSSTHPHTLP